MRIRHILAAGMIVGVAVSFAAGISSAAGTAGSRAKTAAVNPPIAQFQHVIAQAEGEFVTAPGGLDGKEIPLNQFVGIKKVIVPPGAVGPGSTKEKVALIGVAPSAGVIASENVEKAVLKSFGWSVVVISPAATPQGYQSAFNTAISQHVNAILATSISPALVSAQLAAAKKAGIVTVDSAQSFNLDGKGYDAMIDFRHAIGKQVLAMYAIAQSKGHADMVNVTLAGIPDLDVKNVADMVAKTCSACSFKEVTMTVANASDPTQVTSQIQSILSSDPKVNYIIWPTDNVGFSAVQQAIQASGSHVQLLTEDGNPPGMAAVQKGQVPVYGLIPYQWALGLAPVDAVLRLLNHGTPIKNSLSYGIGFHLVTQANAPKGKMTYHSICEYSLKYVDWVTPYEKAWGRKIPSPC